jgi:hypothetical protein
MAIRINPAAIRAAAMHAYEFGPSKRKWSELDDNGKKIVTDQAAEVVRKYEAAKAELNIEKKKK